MLEVIYSAVVGVFKKFAWGSVEYYCRSQSKFWSPTTNRNL